MNEFGLALALVDTAAVVLTAGSLFYIATKMK